MALGQTTRERVQSHLSADKWIKALLSKTLPTRARPSFPITSPSHQEAYPSLLASAIRGQTEETRRSSASQQVKQTILQKANHDNKTGSCVPDERTRYNPRKLTKWSGDRQCSRKRIHNNDSEDDPESWEKNEVKDWVDAWNVYQRPGRTKEQTNRDEWYTRSNP